MIKYGLILILSIITIAGYAQHVSVGGRFSIPDSKGCNPLTITVSAPQCNSSFSCSADFGDGVFRSITDGYTFQYTEPDTYTITVVFGTTGTDQLTLEVTPNIEPEFDIYSCSNNSVQLNITDTNYQQYVIDYNDGSPSAVVNAGQIIPPHTYTVSGNKTVTVRGRNLNANDNCNPRNKLVEAITTIPAPTINLLTIVDIAQIQLDFNNTTPTILYRLEMATNGNAFLPIQNVYNVNTLTLSNLSTDNNYYCFRLQAYDPCNNIYIPSNTICSSNFDITASNNNNRLSWSTSTVGVADFTINKTPGSSLSASASTNVVNDNDVNCGTSYCYQLITNYPNNSRSISLQKCVTAISNDIPAPIENTSTIVNENSLQLSWIQPISFTANEYTVTRSAEPAYITIGTATSTQLNDESYVPTSGSCYRIAYTDVCANQSPASGDICPLQLIGVLQPGNAVSLTWNAYNGYKNGVANYIVEKYDNDGILIGTLDAQTATSIIDDNEDLLNQVYIYRVVAQPLEAGIATSLSNRITIIKEPNLYYPTAFTPNGDGLNDNFLVFSQYTSDFELKIFNRWGELLFITQDIGQGWDGTYKGNKMQEGTYVFAATITDFAGRKFDRSGTVVLLKK